jgi:ubiquinone/menaquinone biosynthesis C-methylase UbiE
MISSSRAVLLQLAPNFMRVLDLGCGEGLTPGKLSLPASWQIIGVDRERSRVSKAHHRFPDRVFVCSVGERLPFADEIFDRVISNVALPYMRIPKALAEIYRVLAPGGTLLASLHPVSFTLSELRSVQPKLKPAFGRVLVLANGIVFHVAGRNFGEAFQTERGITIALKRARFENFTFRHDSKRWFVEANKPAESNIAA